MTSAVGLTALNAIDVKTVTAGDFVTVLVSSPGGGFVGGHIIVVAEAFPTGNPPVSPFPGIVVSATASTTLVAGAGASPFGNPLLSPIGFAVSFNVPSGLVGVSGVFQGIVPSIVAANGIFGSTCGFEFQVM